MKDTKGFLEPIPAYGYMTLMLKVEKAPAGESHNGTVFQLLAAGNGFSLITRPLVGRPEDFINHLGASKTLKKGNDPLTGFLSPQVRYQISRSIKQGIVMLVQDEGRGHMTIRVKNKGVDDLIAQLNDLFPVPEPVIW